MSRSRHTRAAAARAGVAALLFAITACRGALGPPPPSVAGGGAPTAVPDAASPPVSAGPTPDPTMDRPPDATLAAEGGDPVVGQLGTYLWGAGGSDSPWLPGAPIVVGTGEPLLVRIAGDVPVASWRARRAPADDVTGVEARPSGDGGDVIGFAAPEPGAWTVEVTVQFRDGGSATYVWRLEVS